MSDDGRPGPRIADGVVFRELDGEALILDLEHGTYFGLDEVGTRIWRRLDRRESFEIAVDDLVAEYDVDRETARADVRRLVATLLEKGLLVAGDSRDD